MFFSPQEKPCGKFHTTCPINMILIIVTVDTNVTYVCFISGR